MDDSLGKSLHNFSSFLSLVKSQVFAVVTNTTLELEPFSYRYTLKLLLNCCLACKSCVDFLCREGGIETLDAMD